MVYKTHYYICISAVIGGATVACVRKNHTLNDVGLIRIRKPTFCVSTVIAGLPITVYLYATVRNVVPSMQPIGRRFATIKSITMQHSQKSVSSVLKKLMRI